MEFTEKLAATTIWLQTHAGTWETLEDIQRMKAWLLDDRTFATANLQNVQLEHEKSLRWMERRIAEAIIDGQGKGKISTRRTAHRKDLPSAKSLLGAVSTSDIGRSYQMARYSDEEFEGLMTMCAAERNYARARFIQRAGDRRRNVRKRSDLTASPQVQRTTLNGACLTLSGIGHALSGLGSLTAVTAEEAQGWLDVLKESRVEITRTIAQLKGVIANGE